MTARRLPVLILFVLVALAPLASAQVSLTTLGSPSTQSFDTLPGSGSATWTNNSTIPGWFHARTGTGTTVVANNGSSNAGNLYSYGTCTATDRALGSVGKVSRQPFAGVGNGLPVARPAPGVTMTGRESSDDRTGKCAPDGRRRRAGARARALRAEGVRARRERDRDRPCFPCERHRR